MKRLFCQQEKGINLNLLPNLNDKCASVAMFCKFSLLSNLPYKAKKLIFAAMEIFFVNISVLICLHLCFIICEAL